ncbi:MAG: EAL domain-containing protein [Halocynthiibacter sp.]
MTKANKPKLTFGPLGNRSRHIRFFLQSSSVLPFIPALTLGSYLAAGETGLAIAALGFPAALGALRLIERPKPAPIFEVDTSTRVPFQEAVIHYIDAILAHPNPLKRNTACLVLHIDKIDWFIERNGEAETEKTLRSLIQNIQDALRGGDCISRLNKSDFAIALSPSSRIDLEGLIQLSGRLQSAVSTPIDTPKGALSLKACIGFCLSTRAPKQTGESLLEAAIFAAKDAQIHAPAAIRSYSTEMQRVDIRKNHLKKHIHDALTSGAIRPWFQPQVSTDTGEVTGFEALARWEHPSEGLIPPGDFLPTLIEEGLSEMLSECIVTESLRALNEWDRLGLNIPSVGVNFATQELNNPSLVDRLKWSLDAYNISPDRLGIEILENVVINPENDVATNNIHGLSKLGCMIELDDFGTDQASIANIRRFDVGRIKIDRCFVINVDKDREQQKMLSAILSMAERIEVQTLAEGVETPGEYNMLAQLGCDYIQGYGVARPMPFEKVTNWIKNYRSTLADTPKITRFSS